MELTLSARTSPPCDRCESTLEWMLVSDRRFTSANRSDLPTI
jgi:hypothetical protein